MWPPSLGSGVSRSTSDPPWTAGFESQREERRATLDVRGTLPDWLDGVYLANGPGEFEVGGRPLDHWFDPLAALRRLRFADGKIEYAYRFVRSRDFAVARETGRVRRPFPGTPPDRSAAGRLFDALRGAFPDNPVIGVCRLGGETLAVTESPVGLAVDPDDLTVRARYDLTAGLDADVTLGHLHRGPDGGAYNLGASYGREPAYTLFRRPPASAGGPPSPEPIARLRVDRSYLPYVHSFALAGPYAVLTLPPFGVSPRDLLVGAVRGTSFCDAFDAHDDPTRFLVLDRRTGERVATVPADPAFVYHHANGFVDDGAVVLDCVAYPDERAVTALRLATLRSADPDLPRGDLVRYRLPLDGGRAGRETLREGPMEFPTVRYADVNGRRHDAVWVAEGGDGPLPTRLSRVAVPDGGHRSYEPGPGCYPGEPVPVPGPDGETVLLSLVLEAGADRSTLAVLDGGSMTELATAPLPHRLPYAFHGQFYGPTDPGRSVT